MLVDLNGDSMFVTGLDPEDAQRGGRARGVRSRPHVRHPGVRDRSPSRAACCDGNLVLVASAVTSASGCATSPTARSSTPTCRRSTTTRPTPACRRGRPPSGNPSAALDELAAQVAAAGVDVDRGRRRHRRPHLRGLSRAGRTGSSPRSGSTRTSSTSRSRRAPTGGEPADRVVAPADRGVHRAVQRDDDRRAARTPRPSRSRWPAPASSRSPARSTRAPTQPAHLQGRGSVGVGPHGVHRVAAAGRHHGHRRGRPAPTRPTCSRPGRTTRPRSSPSTRRRRWPSSSRWSSRSATTAAPTCWSASPPCPTGRRSARTASCRPRRPIAALGIERRHDVHVRRRRLRRARPHDTRLDDRVPARRQRGVVGRGLRGRPADPRGGRHAGHEPGRHTRRRSRVRQDRDAVGFTTPPRAWSPG